MSRHLLSLPAPEAEWARLPAEEHEKGMRSHEELHRGLLEGGHRLVAAAPMTPSAAEFATRGELIEFRDLVDPHDQDHGGDGSTA